MSAFEECWKCGSQVGSRSLRYVDHGAVRVICDHCNPDSEQNVIARLTKTNAELREVLRTIRTWHKGNGIAEGVIDQALANSSEGE